MVGSSTTLMITASDVGGFNSQISLTCSAPTGLTCSLSPSTISPGSSASSSTLTVSAASTSPTGGSPYTAALLPGLGLFGTLLTARGRKRLTRKHFVGISVLGVLLVTTLFTLGCGGSNAKAPVSSQTTLTVTGTSGALSHTAPVSVTIN
jgi:hypothetical protein